MKYTNGPWLFDTTVQGCREIGPYQGSEVCTTVGLADDDEDAANARLIAEAPAMHECLKRLVKSYGWTKKNKPDVFDILDAVARNET